MGKIKTADPLAGINGKVKRWKAAHIAEVRAKLENEKARGEVKDALVNGGQDFANTPSGSISLRRSEGGITTDHASRAAAWETFARKHVSPEILEAESPRIETFQSAIAPSVTVAAPQAWGVEAKSKPQA